MKLFNTKVKALISLTIIILITLSFQTKVTKNKRSKSAITNKRNHKTNTREGPLGKLKNILKGSPAENNINIFEEAGAKDKDKDQDVNLGDRQGYYDPKLGKVTSLQSGYKANTIPSCLLENKLAHYNHNDYKNQKKLKKCGIKHITKSIDFDKKLMKKCIKAYKERNKDKNKVYNNILANFLNYFTYKNLNALKKGFDKCGNSFLDELQSKVTQYKDNFNIACYTLTGTTDPTFFPPKAKFGFTFVR